MQHNSHPFTHSHIRKNNAGEVSAQDAARFVMQCSDELVRRICRQGVDAQAMHCCEAAGVGSGTIPVREYAGEKTAISATFQRSEAALVIPVWILQKARKAGRVVLPIHSPELCLCFGPG